MRTPAPGDKPKWPFSDHVRGLCSGPHGTDRLPRPTRSMLKSMRGHVSRLSGTMFRCGGNAKSWKKSYPDAKAWTTIVEPVRWRNFDDVRGMFKDADLVDGYVIFNIKHNRYRLVTVIHYAKTIDKRQTQGHVYIRSFLTHKEYDNRGNWDRRYGKQ